MSSVEGKRVRSIFFMIDTSVDLLAAGIDAINNAVDDAISRIRSVTILDENISLKVNVLKFSGNEASWVKPEPESTDTFKCDIRVEDNIDSFGFANFSIAADTLVKSLENPSFVGDPQKQLPPAIIMMVNEPFGSGYENAMRKIIDVKADSKTLIVLGRNIDVIKTWQTFNPDKSFGHVPDFLCLGDIEVLGPIVGFGFLTLVLRGLAERWAPLPDGSI